MSLERWYRWLLAAYPRDHRDVYEEEMVGVLLDGAAPGQTRPTRAEVADLLLGAGRYRLRRTGTALTDPVWRLAGAVTGVLAVMVLVAVHLNHLAGALTERLTLGTTVIDVRGFASFQAPPFGTSDWVPAVAWTAVAVAAVLLPRLVTVALAWLAALLDLALQVVEFQRLAGPSVFGSWLPLLGLVAAGALTVGSAIRPALRVVGWWRPALLGALAFGAVVMTGWTSGGYRWLHTDYGPGIVFGDLRIVLPAFGLLVLIGLDRPVRRRVVALFMPVGVQILTTWVGSYYYFQGFFNSYLWAAPVKWAALVGIPVVTLLVAVAAVQRRERIMRLVALGRSVAAAQVVRSDG